MSVRPEVRHCVGKIKVGRAARGGGNLAPELLRPPVRPDLLFRMVDPKQEDKVRHWWPVYLLRPCLK